MESTDPCSPIGIFDSGIGGFSILRSIRALLPAENIIYYADQAHVPYGPRPIEEVRRFSREITKFLIDQGAKLIVLACNTASAAALHELRSEFPGVPFVGMEPAVKPAAEGTTTGVVGVLATPATFQGALYASVIERFAKDVRVLQSAPAGLVKQIEEGELDSLKTQEILERALEPMLNQGIDTLVLGCTHYPLVLTQLQQIAGPAVRVIDPSPAVARQVGRILNTWGRCGQKGLGQLRFFTTGSKAVLTHQLQKFLTLETTEANIQKVLLS